MAVVTQLPTTHPTSTKARLPNIPTWGWILLAILAEGGLALAIDSARILGLVHSIAILVTGLYAIARRNLTTVTMLMCYIAGCEVLWRQTRAPVYYLIAPYSITILGILAAVVEIGRINIQGRVAVVYFALLLPGVITTIQTAGADARELIAFSLSGPLALLALVVLFSQIKANQREYRLALWSIVIGGIGPLTLALTSLREGLAAGDLKFSDQSNFAASGGFGPVQVSSVLGLCALVSVLLVILESNIAVRVIAGLLAAIFTIQSLLTFSRGGMTASAIALVILALAQARDRHIRRVVVGSIGLALVLGYLVVVPWLIDFTGGAFEKRFSDTSSGRTELAANDYSIFLAHPLFGVGPGMTKYQRLGYETCLLRNDQCANESSSHTEFTRLLGEHGVIGLAAGIALLGLTASGVRRSYRRHPVGAAFLGWAIAQMFYANLRVAAVPLAFGIAFLTITDPDPPPEPEAEPEPAAPPLASISAPAR